DGRPRSHARLRGIALPGRWMAAPAAGDVGRPAAAWPLSRCGIPSRPALVAALLAHRVARAEWRFVERRPQGRVVSPDVVAHRGGGEDIGGEHAADREEA